jgi:predicted SnoaL-like aldol condensation-catalyzing enzyme
MKNKDIAINFLSMASSGKVVEAYEKFVHKNFKHHLMYFKGDRESFMNAMLDNSKQFPNKVYQALRAIEEDNLVVVHGKVILDSRVFGVIHIFRFEERMIIESWEASQEELKDSQNENGLF